MRHLFLMTLLVIFLASCGKRTTQDNNETNTEQTMDKNKEIIDSITAAGYASDSFTTPKGRPVEIAFIKHGSIVIVIDGYTVYIDPVTIFGNDFANMPKADLLLVTHEHHDHLDAQAIAELTQDSTRLIGSRRIPELLGHGESLVPGQTVGFDNARFSVTAFPAYNITPDHLQFHPKERQDIGFIFNIDGLRIYVAGDTENIPEMADLKDIDIAFLPVNQPYTMTPEQAIEAVETIKPKIFYPYHFGETDLSPIVEKFKDSAIDVRVRNLQ